MMVGSCVLLADDLPSIDFGQPNYYYILYSVWGEQQNCVPIIVVPKEVHVLHQMKGQQPLKPVRQNPIISDKFCKSNVPPLATG